MVSFYFEEDNSTPTGYTSCKLDELHQLMSTHHVQIIEINSFADITGSVEINKKLARDRSNFIIAFFKLQNENVEINIHGKSKVPLNFRPYSWQRVDVYYFLGEELDPISSVKVEVQETKHEQIVAEVETPKVPEVNKITENVPVVLAIAFKGGTNKIQKGSQPRLEQLYSTLVAYPELNVHIRGHVCCGNNKLISRKRAKVVYKYLRDKGLDKKRLSFKGYSNHYPLAFPENTAEDRSTNRRVDVIFNRKED